MAKSPEELRAAAARNRQKIDDQLKRTEPQKLKSRDARAMLISAREDNDEGRAALEKMKTLKTIPGFYPTPNNLVSTMLCRAIDLKTKRGDHIDMEELRVLEPSAGKGDIAHVAKDLGATVDCVEINHDLRMLLRESNLNVINTDFMVMEPNPVYDCVLMNPPFENHQDRAHIQHAFEFLVPGGVLVAIASAGALNEGTGAGKNFRRWLGLDGMKVKDKEVFIWNIEEGAFAGPSSERLTNVRTIMIRIIKLPKKTGFGYGRLN